MGGQTLRLVDGMGQDDVWKLDRDGHIEHHYETTFEKVYSELLKYFHSNPNDAKGYCDYGPGGSLVDCNLNIVGPGRLMFPSWGPWPIQDLPTLKTDVVSYTGSPRFCYSFNYNLDDIRDLPTHPDLGRNNVMLPEGYGEDFVSFGLRCDAGSSVSATTVSCCL
jgi:hypothetical protein